VKDVLLLGCGAMGRFVLRTLVDDPRLRFRAILTRPQHVAALRQELGAGVQIMASLDELAWRPDLAVECAGHEAVTTLVPALLRDGVTTLIASVGALSHDGVPEQLERAALESGAQLIVIPGAIGGIDVLAAARAHGLQEVRYVGRKPPLAWRGTPAEHRVPLSQLSEATVIFEGNAREAARLYPKNANVAAMVALAGVGMDRTQVTLIADPSITMNSHRLQARGDFGTLDITVSARAMPDNAKTSALAALSMVRAIRSRVDALVF
jgi:aspartate dehydrogenase